MLLLKRFTLSLSLPLLISLCLLLSACGGETNSENKPPPNELPPLSANAGASFSVNQLTMVQLNAAISDAIVTYQWSQTEGEAVNLINPDSPSPSFTAPAVASNQSVNLVFNLSVSDASGASASDTLNVQVHGPIELENSLPVVSAGDDITVDPLAPVQLNAVASDSDGAVVSYFWQQLGGESLSLSGIASETLSFTAPAAGEQDQVLVFQVTVSDNRGEQNAAAVQVTVPAAPAPETSVFPYAEGHFISAKMPLKPVYPRPDSETQSHARHRWMHSQMPYEVPIGVQGGAWPFKYEILRAPEGSTIGALHGTDNYGVLRAPALSAGRHEFLIRVTDQDLNHVNIRWHATVDDSQFVFVRDGAAAGGSGSFNQPLGSLEQWYRGSADDNLYANKILVLRAGRYMLRGNDAASADVELNSGVKTPSMIGFPGEWPAVDCSEATLLLRGGTNVDDVFIAGIHWDNAASSHFFWATEALNRAVWWNNRFSNLRVVEAASDNPAAIYIAHREEPQQYILAKHNHFSYIETGLVQGSVLAVNRAKYLLIEENRVANSLARYHLYAKGTESFVSIRANTLIENIQGSALGVNYSDDMPLVPHDHELCWNHVVLPSGTVHLSLALAISPDYEGQSYNTWLYRNTLVNGGALVRFKGEDDYGSDGNVVVYESLYAGFWDTDLMNIDTPNLAGTAAEGWVDNRGLLMGERRERLLGTRGHEVATGLVPEPN